MDEPKAAPAPSYWDHHQLNFWLWACLHDAEAYLKADHDFLTSLRSGPGPTATYAQHQAWRARSDEIRRLIDLEKYHFVATMGSLLRILRRSRELFPAIQTTIDNAQHLMKEGKNLRDMIEHADQYREGKGRKQSEFLREAAGIAENIPGDQPGIADATGVIVDDKGHWLGGRLNVEQVIAELRPLITEAAKLPVPESDILPLLQPRPQPGS